jgi:hypothetical protein
MYAPIMDLRALMGVGPHITKHTQPLIIVRGSSLAIP